MDETTLSRAYGLLLDNTKYDFAVFNHHPVIEYGVGRFGIGQPINVDTSQDT